MELDSVCCAINNIKHTRLDRWEILIILSVGIANFFYYLCDKILRKLDHDAKHSICFSSFAVWVLQWWITSKTKCRPITIYTKRSSNIFLNYDFHYYNYYYNCYYNCNSKLYFRSRHSQPPVKLPVWIFRLHSPFFQIRFIDFKTECHSGETAASSVGQTMVR